MRQPITMILALLAAAAAAAGGQTYFATAGPVNIDVPAPAAPAEAPRAVVLTAYGRVWTAPAPVRDGKATLEVPTVRAPAVFDVVTTDKPPRPAAQIVVYPPQKIRWKEKVLLFAAATPDWLRQWTKAVQLPIQFVDAKLLLNGPDDKAPWRAGRPNVLLVGPGAAADDPAALVHLARRHAVNIVVLDAAWYRPKDREAVEVGPAQFCAGGAMADVNRQSWARPMVFSACSGAWEGLANRRGWIESPRGPLVEQLCGPGIDPRGLVVSYLPWQQMLGRHEDADTTFLRILEEAGQALPMKVRTARLEAVGGPAGADAVLTAAGAEAATRPAKADASAPSNAQVLYVLDVRGPARAPASLLPRWRELEGRVGAAARLLVLGDDPLLDEWSWLKIDRKKALSLREGVIWRITDRPGDPARPSVELMQTLTELGIVIKRWPAVKENDNATTGHDQQ